MNRLAPALLLLGCHRPEAALPPPTSAPPPPAARTVTAEPGASVAILGPTEAVFVGARVWVPPGWSAIPAGSGVRLDAPSGAAIFLRTRPLPVARSCAPGPHELPDGRRVDVPWLGVASLQACWPREPPGDVVWTWKAEGAERWVDLVAPYGGTTVAWDEAALVLPKLAPQGP